jgi:hypothetical protein
VARDDGLVGGWVFFGNDLDGGEIDGESGTADFVGLLGVIAFRHQDDPVARCEVAECRLDLRE